jgi:DNA processing protein
VSLSETVLTDSDIFARIRLLRSPGIGPVSYFQLLRRFGHAAAALEALPDLAARGGARYNPVPAVRIESEMARRRGPSRRAQRLGRGLPPRA